MFGAFTFKQFENAVLWIIRKESPYDIILKNNIFNTKLNGKTSIILKNENGSGKHITIKTENAMIKTINIEDTNSSIEYILNITKGDGSGSRSKTIYDNIKDGKMENDIQNINLNTEEHFDNLIKDFM